ncbi:MAG TPA: carcinine hydrolase/isopenicillin-N N-acyltransferase family protein [Dongiaceae bacterium]|nr:carcinine hydrolase/isopenicillin-N N-acyltransferase family protein [Dongiaceae bacterium]
MPDSGPEHLSGEQLPEIPQFDCGTLGAGHLAELALTRTRRMVELGRNIYTGPGLTFADWRSRAWLARNETPFAAEIDQIAKRLGHDAAHALNVSYEWACTTAAVGPVMLRVLDWRFDGMGREIVVAKHRSTAGEWLNVTWPGFVGALTALAPGRFAAALNQAPLRRRTGLLPVDWLIDRVKVNRSRALPATHLLRLAFETCRNFNQAVALLRDTPIALPAMFAVSGPDGQAAIIERQERSAVVLTGNEVMANHWLNPEWKGHGRSRGVVSEERWTALRRIADQSAGHLGQDFSWLRPPVLNKYTRLAAMMNAATGTLQVVGLERFGSIALPATQTLSTRLEPPKKR